MLSGAATTLLLTLLVVGQQQQVAQAWWFLPGSGSPEKAPAAVAAQQPQTQVGPAASTSYAKAAARAVQAPAGIVQATKAQAKFDLDGVKGFMKFSQAAESAPTHVEYDLVGLQGNNKFYHVHVRPVPKFDPEAIKSNATARAQLCGDPATGGHLNPHHITQKLPPKSAPLDKYETGDLSGKHGPFNADPRQADHYLGAFVDDKLPMTGENGIIGRSIVIHKNDGSRWVCATIERV